MEQNRELDHYLEPPLLLQCGCGIFRPHDDYPFVTCPKCGYINCGTKDELAKAKAEGRLMKRVYLEDLSDEQRKKLNNDDHMEREEEGEFEGNEEEDEW